MSITDFNKVFSKKLNFYLNQYDMTQLELSKRLGVGATSVSNWCRGLKSPRMDKVDAMCKIFKCSRSDLMEDFQYPLTSKDEKDIEKILDQTREKLMNQDGLMFDGDPATPEAVASILAAMRVGMEEAKQRNKEKYTPNKYRKD